MSILSEFKQFALKGNAVEMAVGIIIGTAFNKIVNSIVQDLIMPPLGYMIGGVDFRHLAFTLKPALGDQPAVQIRYGEFINTVIEFLIVAWTVFFVVRVMNKVVAPRLAEMEKHLLHPFEHPIPEVSAPHPSSTNPPPQGQIPPPKGS